jgi:hypothetical protein
MTSQQLYADDFSPTLIQSNDGEVLHEALSDDGNQSPENSSSTLTAASPLGVIFNAAGQDRVLPGSRFTLSVTISNKGLQSAVIDVWIEPLAEDLRRWYPPAQERLALGTGQSNEVLFQFQVPVNTLPGSYSYLVVVDAQEHYPEDTPLRFAQQIQVLTATEDIVRDSNPTFVLQPQTSSTTPALLQPGAALQIQVLVENRGDRVDRFRLRCTDLPQEWHTIIYPHSMQASGLVVQPDSLNLNPGDRGLMVWIITPPLDTVAGNYIPTFRIYSDNHPELQLLDLVYLKVAPIYALQVELRTLIGRIERQPGRFQVRFNNTGNTPRSIALQVQSVDEGNRCAYTLKDSLARVLPKASIGIDLEIKPKHLWQRPFYGGRVFNFNVELEDIQQHPLPIDTLPGALLWEPRPWWHFLPFLALGLLGLLAIAYLIWWAFFRVPPPLKIVEFFPEDSLYHAENGDTVRLGWQISEPQHLQSLKISGVSKEGTPLTRPDIYDLSQGIPTPLQPFCTQTDRQLNCRNFPTSARKAGTYQFEMTLQTNKKQDTTLLTRKTGPVEIKPIPLPAIATFGSAQPTYQERRPLILKTRKPFPPNSPSQTQDGIRLNWSITHPDRLQELQLLGRNPEGVVVSPVQRYDLSQGIPPELLSACKVAEQLVCKNVTTNADRPGDYMFELSAIPKRNLGTAIATKKSTLIKVLPKPPQIVLFDINGQPAKPSYLIPIVPAPKKMPRLLLSWQVDAGKGAKVALSPFPGNIPLQGNIPIVLSPKPSTSTITLQVTSAMGEPITRAVTIETYDPKTTDPEKVATAAAKAAAAEIGKAQQQAAAQQAKPGGQQPPFQIPSSTLPPPLTPDSLTPLEIPPQLDRH